MYVGTALLGGHYMCGQVFDAVTTRATKVLGDGTLPPTVIRQCQSTIQTSCVGNWQCFTIDLNRTCRGTSRVSTNSIIQSPSSNHVDTSVRYGMTLPRSSWLEERLGFDGLFARLRKDNIELVYCDLNRGSTVWVEKWSAFPLVAECRGVAIVQAQCQPK